jgi:2-(1,2-epoxy-1,2-dihydrophenyl)acetyl-CoA isomerase
LARIWLNNSSFPQNRFQLKDSINYLFPLEKLQEETIKLALKLAHGPSKAFGKQKKLIEHSFTSTLEEILEEERLIQTLMVQTEDHKEGVAAFKKIVDIKKVIG